MKKFLIFVAVLALLAGGAAIALPRLVSMEKIQAEAKTKFTEATGRDISFSGMKFMFWPNIGLQMKDVTISNPSWAKEKDMVQVGTLDVRLALKPLLDKRVEVKRFTLEKPVIHLETSADGKASWELKSSASGGGSSGGSGSGGDAMKGYAVKLGEFKFADGSVTFHDGKTGKVQEASDIDLAVMLPDLDSSMQIDGALTYKKKRVDIVLNVEKPKQFLAGKNSAGNLSLKTDDMTAKVAGNFVTTGVMMKGNVDANIVSLPALIAWLGDAQEKALPFKTVSFKSGTEVSAGKIALSGAALALDDIKAGGDVGVNYGGTKPEIQARLSMDHLDLDRFTSDTQKTGAAGGGGGGGAMPAAGQTKWDATPIDFSGLKTVNANLILQTKGFSLKGAEVGPSNLSVLLKDGVLNFKSSEASLFDGKFSSDLTLNAAATPTMAFRFNMDGVQAKPVLTTFADFKKLSGAADANVSVTSSGNSQKALIEGLMGQGAVTFRNGSLEGIDLVNIAKMVQNKLADMSIGEGKTDFVELGGTFTITKGVASNNDLKMKGPLVQATGSGTVDLPQKFVQYRVIPLLTASSAVEGASGIKVPVDIKGPFNNIKVRPDYKSVIQGVLENPKELKKTLKQAEDSIEPLKDSIKNIKMKDIKKDPAKALEGLLGSGGLFGPKPQPPPVEQPPPATVP